MASCFLPEYKFSVVSHTGYGGHTSGPTALWENPGEIPGGGPFMMVGIQKQGIQNTDLGSMFGRHQWLDHSYESGISPWCSVPPKLTAEQ